MTTIATTAALTFRRNASKARRSPAVAFVFPAMFPLFIIGLFSQVYRDVARIPGFPADDYVQWMAPAVFLMAAMFGAQYSAQSLIDDVQSGFLDRLRILPVPPLGLIAGPLLFDVVRVAFAGGLVLGASAALGADWHGGVAAFVALPVLLGLWTLVYGGLFYLVGLRTRRQEAMMGLIPLFLPLSMLSTAYVPRELLPGWIQVAARLNPYSYVVDATRMFASGDLRWSTFAAAVAVALASIGVIQGASVRAFRRLVTEDGA